MFEPAGHQQSQNHEEQDQQRVPPARFKLHIGKPLPQRNHQAYTRAGKRHRGCQNPQYFGEGQCDECEIRTLQAVTETQCAHKQPDGAARCNSQRQCQPRVQPRLHLRDGLHIRAGAEKKRMAKRELATKAAQYVPCLGQQGGIQSHHHKIQRDART